MDSVVRPHPTTRRPFLERDATPKNRTGPRRPVNRRTWTLIGATFVALGLGVVALGQVEADADVRFTEDILGAPGSHAGGSYTLLGRPQPAEIPLTGAEGTRMVPNPLHDDTVRTVTAWEEDGRLYHTTHVLTAHNEDDLVTWTYTNETRRPGSAEVTMTEPTTWKTPGYAFPIEAFDDGDGHQPRIWALYQGVLPQPLQPKPSQFTGSLALELAGTPLPPGALVWEVDGIVAQCSSKFLPPSDPGSSPAATNHGSENEL